ncbi:hypothetical protein KCP75_04035 [Salmonella enterica subsp. enterica]|nr:hypothetical protein KCP75_04035 [Salmonella enterica subsp. enterica]
MRGKWLGSLILVQGSALLPAEVLKLAQQELRHGLGTSVMEISHRGKEFIGR